MSDNLVSLALGASGVGGVVVLILGWIIARGMKSRCVVGGNVVSIDVHRQTQAEVDAEARTVTGTTPTVAGIPSVSLPASVMSPTVIEVHTQPSEYSEHSEHSEHVHKTPKAKSKPRDSLSIRVPATVGKPPRHSHKSETSEEAV